MSRMRHPCEVEQAVKLQRSGCARNVTLGMENIEKCLTASDSWFWLGFIQVTTLHHDMGDVWQEQNFCVLCKVAFSVISVLLGRGRRKTKHI